MGGNSEGAKKRLETIRQKYGEDYLAKVGALGGAKSKGRKVSEEHKRKISESMKGNTNARHA